MLVETFAANGTTVAKQGRHMVFAVYLDGVFALITSASPRQVIALCAVILVYAIWHERSKQGDSAALG